MLQGQPVLWADFPVFSLFFFYRVSSFASSARLAAQRSFRHNSSRAAASEVTRSRRGQQGGGDWGGGGVGRVEAPLGHHRSLNESCACVTGEKPPLLSRGKGRWVGSEGRRDAND